MAAISRAHPAGLSDDQLEEIAAQRSLMLSTIEHDYRGILDHVHSIASLSHPGSLISSKPSPARLNDPKTVLAAVAASRPTHRTSTVASDMHEWAAALESTALVTDLDERLQRTERARRCAERNVETLEAKVSALEADNARMVAQLRELTHSDQAAGHAMSNGIEQLLSMARALALSERRVEDKDAEISRLREELSAAPTGELSLLREENDVLTAQLRVLSQQLYTLVGADGVSSFASETQAQMLESRSSTESHSDERTRASATSGTTPAERGGGTSASSQHELIRRANERREPPGGNLEQWAIPRGAPPTLTQGEQRYIGAIYNNNNNNSAPYGAGVRERTAVSSRSLHARQWSASIDGTPRLVRPGFAPTIGQRSERRGFVTARP